MRLLLDTNVLLRLAIDSREISESSKEEVESGLAGGDIAVESVLLMNTGFHNDPADQLIVATAMLAGMRLATTDRQIVGWARRTRLLPLADPTARRRQMDRSAWQPAMVLIRALPDHRLHGRALVHRRIQPRLVPPRP